MSPETTDLDWITERLSDVPAPDAATTEQARAALMEHLSAAPPIAPARDRHDERRRRANRPGIRLHRRPLSLGLAAIVAAAGAFALVNVLDNGGHGTVASAQAATIVAHARTALTAAPGQVSEYTVDGDSTWAIGTGVHPDYVFTQHGGGLDIVDGQQDGMVEFYDAPTNTIYRDSDTARAETVNQGQLLENMESNGTKVVDENTELDGRAAESITSTDARGIVYELWVDPNYGDRPLKLTVTPPPGSNAAPITATWSGYRTVTPSAGTPSPALLTNRYPTATVKTLSDAAYLAAGNALHSDNNG